MSQHHSKNRRTPLTLGQQHHNKTGGSNASGPGNTRKTGSSGESGDSRSSTPTVAAAGNEEPNSSRSDVYGPKSAKENALRLRNALAAKTAAAAADKNSSEVIVIDDSGPDVVDLMADSTNKGADAAAADKKGREKAPRKDKEPSAAVNQQPPLSSANGGSNGKPAAVELPAASPKAAAAAAPVISESPRQKTLRENREKETEAREIAAALAAFQAQDEAAAVAAAPSSTPEKPNSGNRRGQRIAPNSSPISTPSKKTSKSVSSSSPPAATCKPDTLSSDVNDVLASTEMDEVMESLQMESDVEVAVHESPVKGHDNAAASPSAGKILKLSQSPAAAAAAAAAAVDTAAAPRSRLSPYATRRRLSTEDNVGAAAAVANLSTVSERSNEYSPAPAAALAAAVPIVRPAGLPQSLRQISGRRSTRPLRELALQHASATAGGSGIETYRRVRTELDDSCSSMNVTVGSMHEPARDEPAAASRKRTGAALGGSEPDLAAAGRLAAESPKKPRLDLSGFFGMMASPVTLLRNKFSRTSLLCSTPVKLNVDAAEEEDDEEQQQQQKGADDELREAIGGEQAVENGAAVEDVLAENGAAGDVNMIVEDGVNGKDHDADDRELVAADQTDVEAEIAEAMQAVDGGESSEPAEGGEIVVEGEKLTAATEDDQSAEAVPVKAKKSSCLIM